MIRKTTNLITEHWNILLLFGLVTIIFWKLLYPPGVRVANDFHFSFPIERHSVIAPPFLWNNNYSEGLGHYRGSVMWTWLLEVATSVFFIFIKEQLTLYLFLVLVPVVSAYIGFGKIFSKVNKGKIFLASFFYILNTYFILLLDGGQFGLVLAYGFLPLIYILFKNSLDLKPKNILLSALGLSLLSFLDIRILYILGIILFVNLLFDVKNVKGYIISGIINSLILILIHAYWLFPMFYSRFPSLPTNYGNVAQTDFLSFAELKHAVSLLQPHWYRNIFGNIPSFQKEFIILPAIILGMSVISILFFKKNRKRILFWFLLALIGIFLVKGSNPPFGEVYKWIFVNIPGFSMFRDPTKFYFIIAFSYSVLLGELWELFGLTKIKRTVMILIVLYMIFLVRPVWLGKMTGLFSQTPYQNELLKLPKDIDLSSFGRILWLPKKNPIGYSSFVNPSIDAELLSSKRPYAIGTVGKYEYLNFLRESPFVGELNKILGIKYVAYSFPDARREELKQDNIDYYYSFLNQLTGQSWIESAITRPPVAVLKTKNNKDHLFLAGNAFLIIGSDRIYWDLVKIPKFDLSQNILVFAEEFPDLIKSVHQGTPVILYDKNELDMKMLFADRNEYIFPAEKLDLSPSREQKWWKRESTDLVWWHDFMQTKYGIDNLDFDYQGGWSIAERDTEYEIKDLIFENGKTLYGRLLESSRGGRVEFWQANEKIGEVITKTENPQQVEVNLSGYADIPEQQFSFDKADVRWFEVGKLYSNQQITIKTYGSLNVINTLLAITDEESFRIDELIHQYDVIKWNDLSAEEKLSLFADKGIDATLSYKRINPTKYEVVIDNLEKPAYLVFSDSYDELWNLDGQKPTLSYSMLNSYYIDKSGKYILSFAPQKYVYPGLIISMITLIFVIILIRKLSIRH